MYSCIYDAFVVLSFVVSVLYGYKKGFLNGLVSVSSCFFSFFAANFFGKFFLRSSVFSFLSSLNWIKLNQNLNFNFTPERGTLLDDLSGNGGPTFSNYFVLWFLIFVLFAGFKRLFRKIMHLAKFVKKIPIINDLDGLLGGLFGAIEAALFLFAVACGCFLVITVTKNSLIFLNTDVIDATNLFFLFYKFLPFIKV